MQAVYNGVTIQRVFTIAKARQGQAGSDGNPGSTFGGTNITDWTSHISTVGDDDPFSSILTFAVDWTNNYLYVRPYGNSAGDPQLDYHYDLEVIGASVTGVTVNGISGDGTTNNSITDNGAPLDFGTDDAVNNEILWGSNGVIHNESLAAGGNADEYRIALDTLDDSVEFRVKVREWSLDNAAIGLGDRWAQRITQITTLDETFTQFYFNVQDGQVVLWQGSLASAPANPRLNWAYYDTTQKKAFIWDGDSWEVLAEDPTPIRFNYAGRYASFETDPPQGASAANATPSYVSDAYVGDRALQIVATGTDAWAYLGDNNADYNLAIPGNEKWILSSYVKLDNVNSPKTTNNVNLYVKTSGGTHYFVTGSVAADGNWHRVEGTLDLSADGSTNALLRVDNDSHNAAGDTTMHFDGLQLELDSDGLGVATELVLPTISRSVHVATVYRRSAGQPATPTGGSFDFGTDTLTPPTNWSETPPADDGNPLWVSRASFSVAGVSGIDSTTTWGTPARVQSGQFAGALNVGRAFNDLSLWYTTDSQTDDRESVPGPFTIATPADAPIFATALQGINNDDGTNNIFSERI
ncbi:MAG: hypothetical protein GWN30_21675, partial [Gammaproteobacteria bacterium]|nr:hypothetical protein [Gammaproteobacteria bacterium]NIW96782.1 hypothetical protein [Phycisphaerae bacterium]